MAGLPKERNPTPGGYRSDRALVRGASSPALFAAVEWRITFFVHEAERTADGWLVQGEAGLGPPEAGDQFSFVHHEDLQTEDPIRLRITEADPRTLRLVGGHEARLRPGDILGGEVGTGSPR